MFLAAPWMAQRCPARREAARLKAARQRQLQLPQDEEEAADQSEDGDEASAAAAGKGGFPSKPAARKGGFFLKKPKKPEPNHMIEMWQDDSSDDFDIEEGDDLYQWRRTCTSNPPLACDVINLL